MEKLGDEAGDFPHQRDEATARSEVRPAQLIFKLGEHLRFVLQELEPLVDRYAHGPKEVDRHKCLERLCWLPKHPTADRVESRVREKGERKEEE